MSREHEERDAPMPPAVADVVELLSGQSGASKTFLGGLIAGALVGAAVAGSGFLRRRKARGR